MQIPINRRDFVKLAAWFSAVSLPSSSFGNNNTIPIQTTVPRQPFGKSGIKISKLCLGGGSFSGPPDAVGYKNGEALLEEALKYGVDCWEIVSFSGNVYRDYFKKNPGIRDRIFLTGKVISTDPVVMQAQLDKLLQDNGTSFVDFLAIHQIDDISMLNNDIKKWVNKAKKEKKIRFFGFCTHKNMDACLSGAVRLGWIDGVQTIYNYRMQNINSMEDALSKCHEKGVGIFAIKSMGLSVQKKKVSQKLPTKKKLDSLLKSRNTTFEQSKLKAIWRNPSVTSICSLMPYSAVLRANVSAATDEKPLTSEIVESLSDYAKTTGNYFCRRCGICDAANPDKIPIFEIMGMLMYSRGYGLTDGMTSSFARIPDSIRKKIPSSDYSGAENICPQKMPIARLLKEAYMEFTRGAS